jgi:ABC-type Fe3+ transport system permease subunit
MTLPMVVWGLWLGGSLNQAAAANLVILAFMVPLILIYFIFGRRTRFEDAF